MRFFLSCLSLMFATSLFSAEHSQLVGDANENKSDMSEVAKFHEMLTLNFDKKVMTAAMGGNSPLIAIGFGDGSVEIWHYELNKCISIHQIDRLPIIKLRWSKDLRYLFTKFKEEVGCKVWDLKNDVELPKCSVGSIESSLSPDGKYLAYYFIDRNRCFNMKDFFVIMEVSSGKKLQKIEVTGQIYCIEWSPDSSKVALSDEFGVTVLDNVNEMLNSKWFACNSSEPEKQIFSFSNLFGFAICWSPDSKALIVGNCQGAPATICNLDLHDISQIPSSEKTFWFAWSPCGKYISTGKKIFNLSNYKKSDGLDVPEFVDLTLWDSNIKWSSCGNFIAFVVNNHQIKIFVKNLA